MFFLLIGPIQCLAAVLLLLSDLCAGERIVSIQKGLLYRARGYHVTIWCNVSGYQGPMEQNFEWSIHRPSDPNRKLQIISTDDASFPYAIYSQRVGSREIYIERIRGDSVLLHITELRDVDAGEYECYTPSTDTGYLGTYGAKTNLFVIPDLLAATMRPQALIRDQGDSLELICEVSTATVQHTHLSVGWYLLPEGGNGQAQRILSLSRDFVLLPGSSYNQRFSSGDIRLDKIGVRVYKLSIVSIQPSDQGEVYCEAVEWIQDPNETWKDIARKQTDKTSLTIRSLDKNFDVDISVAKRSLLEGEALQMNCSVKARNKQNRWFQVVWRHHGMVMASLDHYGTLSFQNDNEERHTLGNLLVKKQTNDKYILRINKAELKDKGTYSCFVSEVGQTPTGSFAIAEQKSSSAIDIDVKPRESHLKLFVWVNKKQIMEGETLVFNCNVSIAANSLSVNWWHIQRDRDPPLLIASMERNGRLKIGASYLERSAHGELRLEKRDPSMFTLTIYNTLATKDTGLYRCEVTEWSESRSWKHTQEISTRVEPLGQNLKAILSSRVPNVKLQEDLVLFCNVAGNDDITNNVPVSITWLFQPHLKRGGYQQVVKVTARGTIEWGLAFMQFEKKTKITKSSPLSQLLIHSVTWQETGMYKCEVEIWRNSQDARNLSAIAASVLSSNPVEIKVTQPESNLRINMDVKSLEITSNEDVRIDCRIRSLTNENSWLGVAWYFLPFSPTNAVPLLIIRTNYTNILEYGEAFSSLHQKSRFHNKKVSNHLYQLLILSGGYDARGEYYCAVDEWIWLTDGGWYKLGTMESGKTTVYFKFSENKPLVERTNYSITVTENEDVTLNCTLQRPLQPTSHFSISWFRVSEQSNTETLVNMKGNGIINYGNSTMARRLHPHCPSVGDFLLILQNVEKDDAGLFYCRVEEFKAVNCSAAGAKHEWGESGFRKLVVRPSVSTSSTQICSSPPLFRFLVFYPLVLFVILMTAFLFLHFKKKRAQKNKLNVWEEKTSVEAAEMAAPSRSKLSAESHKDIVEEETNRLKGNEED
ncbi:immunoglobulin superfamily member 2 [Zootoca vivipara]|uniref:immunoglobulin superfamily member 2 n=1 Tax=Zootoca vivipara TaxID=8524 RepID=UPI00293BBCF0|nr:immunoglobulin superfamily member 2 [Zootoca vivipara]